MLKYYIFALIKANLITLLIIIFLFLLDFGIKSHEYHWIIFWMSNIWFQLDKPSYIQAELIEDKWDFIRLTEGRKWWERYLNEDVRKRLK